jgi:hypothetical protein
MTIEYVGPRVRLYIFRRIPGTVAQAYDVEGTCLRSAWVMVSGIDGPS